jgi:outer membrane biosynthesis protein TonB
VRKSAAVTRRWTLGAVSLFIAGCLNPPPAVETPAAPAASQKVAPPAAVAAETRPHTNGVKFVPPQVGTMQKISGAAPQFPAELRLSGRTYVVSAKICVSNAGVVDSVSILAGNEPALVTNVLNAVKEWRYTPLTVNGSAIPFCYPASFQFKAG